MKKILVTANPSLHLDHKGRPACAVQTEGALTWIGAHIDHELSQKEGSAVFTFTGEPVEVEASAYYLRQVEEGALLLVEAPVAVSGDAGGSFAAPSVARAIPRLDVDPKS